MINDMICLTTECLDNYLECQFHAIGGNINYCFLDLHKHLEVKVDILTLKPLGFLIFCSLQGVQFSFDLYVCVLSAGCKIWELFCYVTDEFELALFK